MSKFEAKHIYYEYVCLTTSERNYKNNNFTLSTQGLIFYLRLLAGQTLLLTHLTKWWVKWFKLASSEAKILIFMMAWLCFLYYFINGAYYDYDTCTMFLFILFKPPKGLIQPFYSKACFQHVLRRKTTSGGARDRK